MGLLRLRINITKNALSNMRQRSVFLIACGKRKARQTTRAKDLYQGTLFRRSLAYARRRNADLIFILSAKYGLLELGQEVSPYERTLNKMPAKERQLWAGQVLATLRLRTDLKADKFVILAGENYCRDLLPHLPNVERPLLGLTLGRQLQALGQIDQTQFLFRHS